MDFEVFTYGGGEFLRITFNALAALFDNGDYIVALKAAALMGLIVVLIQAAFKGSVLNFSWLIAIIFAFYAAIVPRSTVIITDRIDDSQSSVVNNVPLGLAMTAGLASAFGDWAAQAFEALFSLPDDMEYTKHGILWGSRLVEASTHFEITDVRTQENLAEFWQQCVFYDVLLNQYSWNDLYWHPDDPSMWEFIQGHTSIVRAFPYLPSSGSRTTLVCREAVDATTGPLAQDVEASVEKARKFYGLNLARNQAATPDDAIAKFSAAMPVSYQYLTGLSMSAEQIIRQNALANSMKRGVSAWAAKVDAPAAAQDFALARAEAERRTAYAALGELAARMLPLVKNILEAFVYSVFPIVGLMLMLPIGAQVAIAYVKMVVWIQLWAPIYAVLHGAITLYARLPTEAALTYVDDAGNQQVVLSMANYTGLAQVLSDHSVLAGYLTLSVPMIAYMLVSASGSVASATVGRILQSYEGPVSQGASEASSGNISLGNTSLGNANWWAQNTAPSSSMGTVTATGADGIKRVQTREGEYVDIPNSRLPVNTSIDSAVRETVSQQQASSVKQAQKDAASYGESTIAALTNLDALNQQISKSQGYAENFDKAEVSNFQQQVSQTQSLVNQFAERNGLERNQAAAVLGAAALGVSQPGALKIVSPVDASGSVQISGTSTATNRETFDRAQQFAKENSFGTQLQSAVDAGYRLTASYSGQVNDSGIKQTQASFAEQKNAEKRTEASLERAQTYTEARDVLEGKGFNFSVDLANQFRQYIANTEYRGNLVVADNLLQRAQTDRNASEKVVTIAKDFARDEALRIAGLGNAPTPSTSTVEAAGKAGLRAIEAEGQQAVRQDAGANRGAVSNARAAALPDGRSGILESTGEAKQSAGTQRRQTSDALQTGQTSAQGRAAPLEQQVHDNTTPENQGLLLDAMDGMGKVLPYQDKFSGLLDKLKPDSEKPAEAPQ